MSQEALDIFDVCNTILVSIVLLITLPIAIFVYSKLIFTLPYSRNFTFKLIAFNGITELLSCLSFLLVNQIASFGFARSFILYLQDHRNVDSILRTMDYLFNGLALHSAFFVALNRLKTMVYIKRNGNDRLFVSISIAISFILSSLKIIDLFFFTNQYYAEFDFGSGPMFLPEIEFLDETLHTITDVEIAIVSGSTLAVNIFLAFLLTRRRKTAESHGKFKVEKGLVITSFVSYIFYTLYYVNNCIARYVHINFCGYTQFLFLGLASLTPFWCLIIFAPTIRQFAFKRQHNCESIQARSKANVRIVQATTTIR